MKAEIRKKIGKQSGDYVKVILYQDESKLEIPLEIIECFKTELETSYKTFLSFNEGGRKNYLDWIYEAKTEEVKATRIIKMMDRLQRKLNLFDKKN